MTASFYEEKNHIFLRVSPSEQRRMLGTLGQLDPAMPLVFLTQVDTRANACMYWLPGQKQPKAITPPNSDASRHTGAFLALVPGQDANRIQMVEDGFSIFLTNTSWRKVREALVSGTDLFLPASSADTASLSIEWGEAGTYTSPVTGERFLANGWAFYRPKNTSSPSDLAAMSRDKVVLLTSERDLQTYTTVHELVEYLKSIKKAVDTFFAPQERETSREIAIQLALTVGGHVVKLAVKPDLTADVADDLRHKLQSVPSPKVGGPVKLEYILNIGNVSGEQ